jgi:hypothetical protein
VERGDDTGSLAFSSIQCSVRVTSAVDRPGLGLDACRPAFVLRVVVDSVAVAFGMGGCQKVGRGARSRFMGCSSVPGGGMATETIHMRWFPFENSEKSPVGPLRVEIDAESRKTTLSGGLSLVTPRPRKGPEQPTGGSGHTEGHLDGADRRGTVVWRHMKGPGGPRGPAKTSLTMKHRNLILQWLNHCTPGQRRRLADRITHQLESAKERRNEDGEGPSPTQIMSTVLFVECAGDLDLQPLELHGLMHDPKVQSLEAVVALAMSQLEQDRSSPVGDRASLFDPAAITQK